MVVASFNALEKVNFGGLRLAFQIKLGVSANIGLSVLKVASDAYSVFGPTYESECSLRRRVQPETGHVLRW